MILLCRDIIYLWLVYYGYQEAQARRVVQFYYVLLATMDKDRLYKEFRKPNLEIRIRVYTYILISLEILVSKSFYKTLTNPTFYVHVGLVVINEVHFMANQGGLFWSLYIQLQKVWSLLGQRPWFACTAILNNIIFKIV